MRPTHVGLSYFRPKPDSSLLCCSVHRSEHGPQDQPDRHRRQLRPTGTAEPKAMTAAEAAKRVKRPVVEYRDEKDIPEMHKAFKASRCGDWRSRTRWAAAAAGEEEG